VSDEATPPSRSPRLPILFEDGRVVAIDKPAGLESVPSQGTSGRTALSELRASHPTAAAVHRLDRDVSGVMLFALDEPTRAALEEQFRARSLDKVYLAVVSGTPRPPDGSIRKPIVDLGKHARIGSAGGRARGGRGGSRGGGRAEAAVTHYEVRERLGPASLVEVRLETGRYNQIRLHFAAIGHALVGERKYARGRDSPIRFRRVALHAWRLAFDHPSSRVRVELEAPLPDDFARLLDTLRR
jgi:RluA family pseudouridine synthase